MNENWVLVALIGAVLIYRLARLIAAERHKSRTSGLKALQSALPKEVGK